MNLRQQLEQSLSRHDALERQMSDPVVLADSNKIAGIAREHGSLSKVAGKYRAYKRMTDEMRELEEMASSSDQDEKAMATEELEKVRQEREKLWEELLDFTIGGDDANRIA